MTLFIINILVYICFMIYQVITYRREKNNIHNEIAISMFLLTLAFVFALTGISPLNGLQLRQHGVFNIIPSHGLGIIMRCQDNFFRIKNIFGNIIMFVPIGFLLPTIWRKYRDLYQCTLFGMLLSLSIEVMQMPLSRGTDIDDIILNTLGVVLGYGVYIMIVSRNEKNIAIFEDNKRLYSPIKLTLRYLLSIVAMGFIILVKGMFFNE